MTTIYSRKTCGACHTLKNYLDKKSVDYVVLDLDDQPELEQRCWDLVGYLLLPTVETHKGVVAGLNIPKILSIL